MKKIILASCLLAAATAFAQFGGFGGPQGGGSVPDADKTADVNYAGDGKTYHTLDIYIPKEAKDSYPVVIHTYGSAWSMNNMKGSADLSTICAAYAKAGYAVVTPNHRSASDAIYPAQLHDIKAVVRFVRGNAAKYKFDTNFVAVSGFSSGGHLSSLVATTCGLKEGKSGSVTVDLVGNLGEFTSFSSCVDGAVLWSPPTDIYTMNPISIGGSGTMEGAFIGVEREGNKDKWMVASSPYYASDDDPPVIIFHGTKDQVVNIEQSKELYDSLKHHNVVVELDTVPNGEHGGNVMYATENLNKAVAFLDKAREAKAAAAVVPPDTSKQDTSVTDTSKTDTLPPDTQSIAIHSMRVPMLAPVSYSVYSLDGTLVSRSSVLNKQALRPGVYYVVSKYNTGERKMFRIVKR
ncbi:alpha/beta hydrolase [Fibrobacter sp. UWR2]|uniref:alpha/beta hydrolase n=1 Tax=Fibrobacter sp. UWR2 TaxID=1964352 RepID=UPI000B52612E|nr:alpha/beta hydrolase [Fibrobacter sp. UWR2]OWV01845.1 esterase [Fibrobacter sp. UWR2]